MTTPHHQLLTLALICLGTVAGAAAATEPPLPSGAYAEWSLAKAWRQDSSHRGKVCLNGLWRFRSEPRLEAEEVVETFFEDDLEDETLSDWSVGQVPGGTLRASLDRSRRTRGSASMKVELDIPENTNFYHITRRVDVPVGTKLVVRADMRVELERGELHIEVQDARDYRIYTIVGGKVGNLPEWKTVECGFVAPPGSATLKVFILRNHGSATGCKGTVWIDNLRIVQVGRPAAPGITPPTDERWGLAKVPGSWNTRHWSWRGKVYWHTEDTARTRSDSLRFGWFERELTVPGAWEGRRIMLGLDRVATDARVYCDGVEAGSVDYMGGEVDITRFAQPGKTLRLSLLVQARDSWDILPDLLAKPSKSWQAKLPLMGVAGDVFLLAEPQPAEARLGRCRVVTSVRAGEIQVVAELLPPPDQQAVPQGLAVRCEVRDEGRVVKRFQAPVPAGAASVVCTGGWADAELWDIGKPRLYTLHAALVREGRVIDEALPERFGFREFDIRGRCFYLNAVKLNLVPSSYCGFKHGWATKGAMRHWLKGAREAGYNFVYLGETDRPGKPEVASHLLQVCDEVGMLAAVSPLGVGHSVYRRLDKPETWERWTGIVRQRVRKDWNHPSLVLWRMNMNLNCYRQDQNPLVLDGRMEFEPDSESAVKQAAMLKSNAFVRALDPTRPTYNHACGKTGEIYTLNNYLGWPELQDVREWLRVWAATGDKPLYMAEQATPYPGDFQMRDPTNWWTNEPLMTEYGAILLGERSYRLEEHDYVGYYDHAWDGKGQRWRSSYGYYCHGYPPILDECSARYYEVLLPAWRTWGISGGVNAWENTWRRLVKRKDGSVLREAPPDIPLDTDWASLQRPGFSADVWQYASGGGGEIRCLFDLGRPEESEYLEPTLRSKVMPELIASLYAYIAGPGDAWFAQDHAFYSGEEVAKSVVLLNDRRERTAFTVRWLAEVDGTIAAEGAESATVGPAESARVQVSFRAPPVQARTAARITAEVSADGRKLAVQPFALQLYPRARPTERTLRDWALFDPGGDTAKALGVAGLRVRSLAADEPLPADLRVLVIGCNALGDAVGTRLAADLPQRLETGLQVLVLEQTAETLSLTFGLRCFTPGVRQVWRRDAAHPVLAEVLNEDLADWRGATTLGPLDGPPADLDESQRWQRVWRCSQRGVVASTIVEKPHLGSFRALLDTGFDLRYTPLWEVYEGTGRMVFCQLDLTDRIGLDPVADRVLGNLIADLERWHAPALRAATRVAESANAPLDALPMVDDVCPANGVGHVLVLPRGSGAWLTRNAAAVPRFLTTGGTVLAAGLSRDVAEALARCAGGAFTVESRTRWLNPLSAEVPTAFRGISPAAIHWRRKLTVAALASIAGAGWCSETGVLGTVPVGNGEIVWVSALPEDFDPALRPDLVFTRVNTERLYAAVLANLGVQGAVRWSSGLVQGGGPGGTALYTDKRVPRDDPYADMRW